MSGFESSNSLNSSPRDSSSRNDGDSHRGGNADPKPGLGGDMGGMGGQPSNEDNQNNVAMMSPLMSPPPLQSANDYGIETIC